MKSQFSIILTVFAFLISSCSKDSPEPEAVLNQSDVTLHYDEDFQFVVTKGDESVAFSTLTVSVSNEHVGEVTSTGLFEAKRVGETTINITGQGISLTAKVTVKPYHTLFSDPYLNFGDSKASVKGFEKRNLEAEIQDALLYKGENANIRNVMYTFDSGELFSTYVLFTSTSFIETTATYYQERFEFLGAESSEIYFIDRESKVAVVLSYNTTLGFHATYFDASSISMSAINKLNTEQLFEAYKTIENNNNLKQYLP